MSKFYLNIVGNKETAPLSCKLFDHAWNMIAITSFYRSLILEKKLFASFIFKERLLNTVIVQKFDMYERVSEFRRSA